MTQQDARPKQTQFWLVKTEPQTFSIEDLRRSPNHTTRWDGVRNYQARNFLRDALQVGDGVLIYHSMAKPLAIVGRGVVVRSGYPDPSQYDPESPSFDPRAVEAAPRWFSVDIQWQCTFAVPVQRAALIACGQLDDLMLLARGSRLSVQPVAARAWGLILAMGEG